MAAVDDFHLGLVADFKCAIHGFSSLDLNGFVGAKVGGVCGRIFTVVANELAILAILREVLAPEVLGREAEVAFEGAAENG